MQYRFEKGLYIMDNRIKLTDHYATAEGFLKESYLLDCVQRGLRSNIEAVLSSEEYLCQMKELFGNDISFAKMVFSFIWPKIIYAAVEGGLSEASASKGYDKYYYNLQHAPSVRVLLEMNRRIFTEFADKVASAGADAHLSILVCKIHRYISTNIYEKLTVNHIAQKLHLSRSHLSHVYKHETGETITDGIRHRKILEAKRLIQYSSLSLTDIGSKLGFCSQSHFIDVFRKESGMTPCQYRNLYQEKPD
ncbi:MAG: AraC family transcriptional regulator [Treponema sp.]|nr:AraC family transcriptional regulator [Treponema sp.]